MRGASRRLRLLVHRRVRLVRRRAVIWRVTEVLMVHWRRMRLVLLLLFFVVKMGVLKIFRSHSKTRAWIRLIGIFTMTRRRLRTASLHAAIYTVHTGICHSAILVHITRCMCGRVCHRIGRTRMQQIRRGVCVQRRKH